MRQEIKWQMRMGTEAIVAVEIKTRREVNLDGDVNTVDCCDLVIEAEIDGMGIVGIGEPELVIGRTDGIVARIGKLALDAGHLAQVQAAIAEAKATPEWQARIAREAQAAKDKADYAAHRRMMDRAMGKDWTC